MITILPPPPLKAIEVDQALELLSASFAGINPLRRYAVKRLEEAKVLSLLSALCSLGYANQRSILSPMRQDEELLSYLLQLVQALRYEKGFLSDEQILASQTVRSFSLVPLPLPLPLSPLLSDLFVLAAGATKRGAWAAA